MGPLHLRNMQTATELGAIILPPMLTFYTRPASVEAMIQHMVGKILDVFGLDLAGFQRWDPAATD